VGARSLRERLLARVAHTRIESVRDRMIGERWLDGPSGEILDDFIAEALRKRDHPLNGPNPPPLPRDRPLLTSWSDGARTSG
jgi:hypothetical protein